MLSERNWRELDEAASRIAKQRNGPIGDFKLVFRNDITKFFNYEPQPEYLPPG